ncbi:hypothetical protein C2G38_363074 [Gigaspora rosea]|uniref:Uncharacterized protein n=1 Tax=Gigaspora rosea TaxID=44941 RepID=A0A397VTV8_9GLOM|nr:hypothetical protein C2G38_363074 [Gigaspora rosea]
MNKQLKDIFSIRVEYEDENTPIIIAHRIMPIQNFQNNIKSIPEKFTKRHKKKLEIGWIIVGYPEDFDFDNTEVILRSDKYDVSEEENGLVAKSPGYLCTCVIEAPETRRSAQTRVVSGDYDPYKSMLIIGTHFNKDKGSACIFIHRKINDTNNIPKHRIKLFSSALEYSTLDKGNSDQASKWIKFGERIFCVDFPDKKDFKSPILVNQLVKNCSKNCQQYHGFLNVNSKKVIYGPSESEPSNFEYVCMVVPKISHTASNSKSK